MVGRRGSNSQSPGQDAEGGGSLAHHIAIRLNERRTLALDADPVGPVGFDQGMVHVGSLVHLRRLEEELQIGDIAEVDDVQHAIIHFGIGRDEHPSPEIATVANYDALASSFDYLAIELQMEIGVSVGEGGDGQSPKVRDGASQRLGRAIDAIHHFAVEAEAGDVDEVSEHLMPFRLEGNLSQIDDARLGAGQIAAGIQRIAGNS